MIRQMFLAVHLLMIFGRLPYKLCIIKKLGGEKARILAY